MKKFLFLAGTLIVLSSASQAQGRPEFADVEIGHWTYAATRKASDWIFSEGEKVFRWSNGRVRVLWTRYEFAVAIARMEDKLSTLDGQTTPYDLNSARDIVAGLHREYEREVERLGMRDPFSEVPRRLVSPRVPPPPRLTITPSILAPTPATETFEELPPKTRP